MKVNSLKRSFGIGSKVSLFTLGTMRALESAEKMYQILKQANFAGINHIETAPSYGKAETFIGQALNKLEEIDDIKKNNWIITSKFYQKGTLDISKEIF